MDEKVNLADEKLKFDDVGEDVGAENSDEDDEDDDDDNYEGYHRWLLLFMVLINSSHG